MDTEARMSEMGVTGDMEVPRYTELKGWNTPLILDATVTVMISHHGYEAVLQNIENKMKAEASDADSDGCHGYANALREVARHVEAAIGTLAFTSKRKPV